MTKAVETLNALVRLCNDGEEFYRSGASQVKSPQLKNVFTIMAHAHSQAVADLAPYIEGRGAEVAHKGTWEGALREGYTRLQGLFRDKETVLIEELAETEDRTLKAFQKAMQTKLPPNVHDIIASNYATFKETHHTMCALKRSIRS